MYLFKIGFLCLTMTADHDHDRLHVIFVLVGFSLGE